METLSPKAVSGDLTDAPSTLSPPLCLAESDPVPSPAMLPPPPQDSPQPLPAPEEEEALTTEDFELLDQGELEQLNAELGLGPETPPEPPDAPPLHPWGLMPIPWYSQTKRLRPWQSHEPQGKELQAQQGFLAGGATVSSCP